MQNFLCTKGPSGANEETKAAQNNDSHIKDIKVHTNPIELEPFSEIEEALEIYTESSKYYSANIFSRYKWQ